MIGRKVVITRATQVGTETILGHVIAPMKAECPPDCIYDVPKGSGWEVYEENWKKHQRKKDVSNVTLATLVQEWNAGA